MGRYSWPTMRTDRLSHDRCARLVLRARFRCRPLSTAQTGRAFTAEDMLKVSTASVLDLSDDGRRAAVSVRRAYDNAEVDNRRYGDPTYLPPSRVTLQVIDTQTGAVQSPFSGLVEIRQAAWSHDGRRLAILTASNGAPARLHIWDAEQKVLDRCSAEGPGRSRLRPRVDRGRQPADRRAAQSRSRSSGGRSFQGADRRADHRPVVQGSFLDWDDLQRAPRTRAHRGAESRDRRGDDDPAGTESLELSRLARLSPDHLHGGRDREDRLRHHRRHDELRCAPSTPPRPATARTIVEAKDLKDVTLRWADDGRLFAFARKGEIFIQRVDDAKARSVTPRPKAEAGKRTETEDRRTRERRRRRRTSRNRSRLARSAATARSCSSPARRAGTSSTSPTARRRRC